MEDGQMQSHVVAIKQTGTALWVCDMGEEWQLEADSDAGITGREPFILRPNQNKNALSILGSYQTKLHSLLHAVCKITVYKPRRTKQDPHNAHAKWVINVLEDPKADVRELILLKAMADCSTTASAAS